MVFKKYPIKRDFKNEEVLSRLLEKGNKKDLKEVAAFFGWSGEEIKLYSEFAKLRRRTINKTDLKAEKRVKENPVADKEELDLGVYKEHLEPQVRDAVLNMRRKGYTTYESGFFRLNTQLISFEKEHLKGFKIPNKLASRLKEKGIDIKIKPDSILLVMNKYLGLGEIKDAWDQIEGVLPELGERAVSRTFGEEANDFRENQKKLNN